jgi:hypothetical protein
VITPLKLGELQEVSGVRGVSTMSAADEYKTANNMQKEFPVATFLSFLG